MNLSTRQLLLVLGAGAFLVMIGAAVVSGVIGPSPERPFSSPPGSPVAARPTPGRARPSPTLAPPTATPAALVNLALTSFDRQPSLGGVTVTIVLENHQSSSTSFSFDPANDLRLVDARGATWPLRWAEYNGEPTVAGHSAARLVRAFFAGPIESATSWPLTLTIERTPAGRTVRWQLSQHGVPTPVVTHPSVAVPPLVANGPITLTVENPRPSSALGGVQVDLLIQNARSDELAFQFDPGTQLTAIDNLGRPYHLRWAQYEGIVRVPPNQTARLARVFFEGPISDDRSAWLKVELRQVPSGSVLRAVVPLE